MFWVGFGLGFGSGAGLVTLLALQLAKRRIRALQLAIDQLCWERGHYETILKRHQSYDLETRH